MNKNRRKYWLMGVFVIIIMTALLRGWHLGEFVLFRADQARDAYLIKDVLDYGPGYFKLLGPKAGASVVVDDIKGAFKLGPVYNYLQFFGVVLSGGRDPVGLVLVDFLLSLFAIGLFYYFLRFFFSKKLSLLITVLFVSSYFLTLYARFPWNINQIVFWELLLVISLMKIITPTDNRRIIGNWFLVWGLSLAVIGQLHILSVVGFTFVSLVIFFIYRPSIKLKYFVAVGGIFLLMYSPMILSDIYNHGDNFQRFIKAGKMEKQIRSPLTKKITKLGLYHGKNYMLILTGINKYDYKKISLVGEIFIGLSVCLIILLFNARKISQINVLPKKLAEQFKKKLTLNLTQKQFVLIVLLWFFVFVLIYFRILPRLHKERYWLMVAPLPFIFLAFWFYILGKLNGGEFKSWGKYITNGLIVVISGVILFSNLMAIKTFYGSLKRGELVTGKFHKKITVGPYRFFTGYGEMRNIVDYFANKTNESSAPALCFKSLEYQNRLGFEYLLDVYYPEIQYKQTGDGGKYNCIFYVITKTSRGERELKDFKNDYNIKERKKFKSLTVWELKAKNDKIKKQEVKKKQYIQKEGGRVIYWKDIFR